MASGIPIYGPRWFNGFDSGFEILSVIAALSIWWQARKIKCLTGEKSCSTLGDAFLLIAISFIIKIMTNVIKYLQISNLGDVVPFHELVEIQVMVAAGYFVYRLLFLIALIWLVCLTLKCYDWRIKSLFVLFAALGTLFSHYSYTVFHSIAFVLLIFIVAGSYSNYKETQNYRSARIALSFLAILLSQVIFLFVSYHDIIYPLGESVQLLGFLGMLYNQVTLPSSSPIGRDSRTKIPIKTTIAKNTKITKL